MAYIRLRQAFTSIARITGEEFVLFLIGFQALTCSQQELEAGRFLNIPELISPNILRTQFDNLTISAKKKHPDVITFKFVKEDNELLTNRFLIPNSKAVTAEITSFIPVEEIPKQGSEGIQRLDQLFWLNFRCTCSQQNVGDKLPNVYRKLNYSKSFISRCLRLEQSRQNFKLNTISDFMQELFIQPIVDPQVSAQGRSRLLLG